MPPARCRAAIASVCSGSKCRRITRVLAIVAPSTRQPNPQAWNIGAATTRVSSVRHGTRSIEATRSLTPPLAPRRAPFGVPVVPLVNRMTPGVWVGGGGRWPKWASISPSTLSPSVGSSSQAMTWAGPVGPADREASASAYSWS